MAEAAFAWLLALSLLAVLALMVADVIGRYVLARPIRGSAELIELLMALVVFMGLAVASVRGVHVQIDVGLGLMPPALAAWLARLADAACAATFLTAAAFCWQQAERGRQMGEVTPEFHVPISLLRYVVALLLLVAAVVHAVLAVHGRRAAGESQPPETGHVQ